ncbi:MAG: DNA polymerase I [Bacteroidales bacterium]|nr:DNA polymerase I [Bacteroidales bacterium]
MSEKLFLIDGHALVFKMYYAFLRRPMVNSKGADMSILYGFTKYLLELIERESPTHIAVAFDPPGGTFRNELYPAYKGTRPPTPQLVIDALDPLREIVGAMNIPVLMIKGFEADDVIGSMAVRSAAEGFDVYMVTPDKDYGQLVADHIFQYKPGKGGSDVEILDRKAVCEKYSIPDPALVVDMLAICGDTADNVPGVKGVGEVGAGALVSKYGSMENIYSHLDELTPRQRALFEEAQPHMALSKTLVTIKTDIPLETTAEDMRLGAYSPELRNLFVKYEFGSLMRHLGGKVSAEPEQKAEFSFTEPGFEAVAAAARKAGCCSLVVETAGDSISAPVTRIAVGVEGAAAETTLLEAKALLADQSVKKVGFDLKRLSSVLLHSGAELEGTWLDIALMHYLLDPEKSHAEVDLLRDIAGIALEDSAPAASLFDDGPASEKSPAREAAAIMALGKEVLARMEKEGLDKLYFSMEEPLAKVLAGMERSGVRVDPARLLEFADGLRAEMRQLEQKIREDTGVPDLNISSPKQVGEVLFDKLKLDPKAKKSSKGQYSTDESTLLDIADRSPVVGDILSFRAVKKLLSTYIEPLPSYISPVDGRIHTTFNQALTATGRLSSSNPNLQNIPVRTERGREIRKAFVPAPGGLFLSADYSQIELRIMAHLSCDAHLISAFRDGLDVHAATAAKIFGIPLEQVSSDQRRIAKTANFGIMYGISAFGLSERLRIPRRDAAKIIEDYFASFPAIKSFIEDTLGFARDNGYVETLFGRRRYLPEITAANATIRALAERTAVNAPIQGTSADIIKLAMIAVDKRIREEGLRSKMVLQIHDELCFDTFPEEVDALRKIVVAEMENVIKLTVPLTVECGVGTNWLEAH